MSKKSVILLSSSMEVLELLKMQIFAEYSFEILPLLLCSAAVDALTSKERQILCIVGDYKHCKEEAGRLADYLRKSESEIPYILLTDKYPAKDPYFENFLFGNKGNSYLKFPIKEEEFLEKFKATVKINFTSEKEAFRRIAGSKVLHFKNANYSIYILNHENEYQLVSNFAELNTNLEESYFVKLEDYKSFFASISDRLRRDLYSSTLPVQKKVEVQYNVITHIYSSLHDLGMSKDELDLAQESAKTCLTILESRPQMSSLLGKMVKHRQFSYELALMSGYLSSAIVMKTNWASEYSVKKLMLASLLQDISLENDTLAKITSVKSPEFLDLTEQEREEVVQHPAKSVELLEKLNNVEDITNNIRNLILEHHERPHSVGFPHKLNTESIPPLSAIFILAHEFSTRILSKPLTRETLKQIVIDFERDYSLYNFKKPYEAFIKVFKNI